jgi:hypothetical protein
MLRSIAALVLFAGNGNAQLTTAPPGVTTECKDINTLHNVIRDLGAEWCGEAGQRTSCSARCGAATVALLERCDEVLIKILPPNAFADLRGLNDTCFALLTSVSHHLSRV